jgi:predicted secreted Zn-dependent protease
MPTWKFPKGYPKQCQAVWNDFVDRARVHEEGHVEIFKKWDKKLRERAAALSREYVGQGLTLGEAKADLEAQIEEADKELQTIADDHDAEQRKYDDVTDHGRDPNKPENIWNRGAMPVSVKCPEGC